MDKQILVIVGVGRSGTTVIERFIAETTGALALGETELLWQRGYLGGEECGCGRKPLECEVWGDLHNALAFCPESIKTIESCRRRCRSTIISWIPFLGKYYDLFVVPKRLANSVFSEAVSQVFTRLLVTRSERVFVDSSKKPVYAAMLLKLFGQRVSVLHVVRDLRGYVWSMRRRRSRSMSGSPAMYRSGTVMSTLRWIRGHARARALGDIAGGYVRLHYEDFAEDPSSSIKGALRQLNLDHSERTLGPGINNCHQVAGNPNRFEGGGLPNIRLDRGWHVGMKTWEKSLLGIAMRLAGKNLSRKTSREVS